jgi:hypothetical protein
MNAPTTSRLGHGVVNANMAEADCFNNAEYWTTIRNTGYCVLRLGAQELELDGLAVHVAQRKRKRVRRGNRSIPTPFNLCAARVGAEYVATPDVRDSARLSFKLPSKRSWKAVACTA